MERSVSPMAGKINLREMTAPCGLDCFNCPGYLANDNEEIRIQVSSRFKANGMPKRKRDLSSRRNSNRAM